MIRVFTAFSGYDSQCMALDRTGIPYELVGWSEIDKYAIQAHNAVYPRWADRNYGDISKIDWDKVPDFDLFTYSFPCFTEDALVLTNNGYKRIVDVALGDLVLTHTNKFLPVTAIMRKEYDGDMVTIKASAFDTLTCTPNHPFYTRKMYRYGHKGLRAFKSPSWVNAADLTKNDYIGYAINTKSELPQWGGSVDNRWGHAMRVNHIAPMLAQYDFWYLMGRYIGDGWKRVSKRGYGNGIVIACSDRNKASLEDCIARIGLHGRLVKERTVYKMHICMNELCSFVDRFGYYAYGKRIDAETLNLPRYLCKALLDGVMDSDGYVNKEHVNKISSVSRELVLGLGQLVAKAYHTPFSMYKTIRPPKVVIEGRTCNQRDTYTITFKKDKRKQDKAFYEDGYMWFPVHKIEMVQDTTMVYNLSVDTDESYTANGAIVHNCQSVSTAGLQKGLTKGSGTTSSLLWECERAIGTKRPKYMLMENVPALVSDKFVNTFNEWQHLLESYGYSNYVQLLNAKDYGVAQSRNRVFMVSILDCEKPYYFPKPFKLTKRLRDYLEHEVDEKYYLSDRMVRFINERMRGNDIPLSEAGNKRVAETILGSEETFMPDAVFYDAYNQSAEKEITGTINTRVDASNNYFVKEPYEKGGE